MNQEYKSLRTQYSINGNFVDDRLIEVNLLVMHDDVNLNYSSFSKETMEDAKDTLKNVPILAYIKKDEYDDVDFDGHNIEIKLKENKDGDMEYKVHYLERPIGVIPETNDYHYEERDGKTYVACKGYLWKEYLNDGLEILQENSTKPISMEILVDDGNYNVDTGVYEITKYRYLGVTVLGTDVTPAMSGAKMDVVGQFSINNNKEFFEKVRQLNKELKQSLLEGGDNLGKEKDFEEEIEETTEQEFETTEEVEETTVDASNESEEEDFAEETVEEKFTKSFELSHDDIRTKLYELLYKVEEEDDDWYYIQKVFDDYFIYAGSNKIYKQGYIKTDVDVAFEGERVEMFIEYLTAEELEELNKMRENYSLVIQENEELKNFKAEVELQNNLAEIEQVFEKYSTLLSNDDYEDLKDKALELGVDNLEKELSFRVVQKKFDFSKITKKDTTKVSIKDVKTEVDPYGSASVYFKK